MEPALLIPLAIAIGAGFVGYFGVRKLSRIACSLIWVALIVFSMAMAGLAETTPGWDAITYFVILLGACAPAGAGLFFGSVFGWYRNRVTGA